MRKKIIIGFVAVLAIGLFTFSTTTKEDAYWEMFFKDYRIYAIPIAEKQSFAGELVPIQDFDVRERLDRELLVNAYWQSTTLLHIKRAAEKKLDRNLKNFHFVFFIRSWCTCVVSQTCISHIGGRDRFQILARPYAAESHSEYYQKYICQERQEVIL
jgi:hypothetical protein